MKRKVKRKKSISKNYKINTFYKKFEAILLKNVKKNNFAIAVSGGPDSLCLAYFGKKYVSNFKNRMHVLIVNHNLRNESKSEALQVKEILNKNGIKSKILNWKGKIPKSNIQSKARNIRYSLISNYCLNKNINYLLTAHHMDDQIENFFIRLFRGSGVTGLSSMSEIVSYNKELNILRPLLNFRKSELEYVTINYFKTFIKDPSNKDEKFLRVRVRKYRKSMEEDGLDTSKIIKTVNNLVSANKALNIYKNKAFNKYVSFLSKDRCLVNEAIFSDEAGEIIFRSFSDILSLVSGTYYPPRSKKVINLIERLKKNKFKKSTLGGCTIEKKDNFISISREQKLKYSIHIGK